MAAAAALRNAARRLEGYLLQRTQAGLGLPRRLVHSGGPEAPCRQTFPTRAPHRPPANANVEHPGAKPAAAGGTRNDGKLNAYRQISDKREELFDLLADTERRYGTEFSKECLQNVRLLQQLAVQVKPRPNDSVWRSKRTSKRINDFLAFTGANIASYMLTKKWIDNNKQKSEATPEEAKTDIAGDKQ